MPVLNGLTRAGGSLVPVIFSLVIEPEILVPVAPEHAQLASLNMARGTTRLSFGEVQAKVRCR